MRTFLSARGKVNRGIQQTLKQNPEMFLAFNNGLSTTASEILSTGDDHTRFIESITNWQIVNGGQTTASLAHYLKSNSSNTLDDVYVQMKLVLVASEELRSEYRKSPVMPTTRTRSAKLTSSLTVNTTGT